MNDTAPMNDEQKAEELRKKGWRVFPPRKPFEERAADVAKLMAEMPAEWRLRWCESECACMGCVNVSGRLMALGYNKDDYIYWLQSQVRGVLR